MSHPLKQNIAALRRRERRLAVIHGVSAATVVVLGVVVLLGLTDYGVRFQDRGLRVIASLVAAWTVGWAVWRYVVSIFRKRPRDIDLAFRVEHAFPRLKNRLMSAIEFLQQSEDDPTVGSAALRRAAIVQATDDSRGLDFCQVLNARPTLRAVVMLAVACCLTGLVVTLNPPVAVIALTRLVNPFSLAAWPQTNHLAIRNPVTRVARGQAFDVEVIDAEGARLPSEVRIHYRWKGLDDAVTEEVEPLPCAATSVPVHRENILRPFSYRVEGGDDPSMTWMDVDVVDPPAIESLDIRLTPPAYVGGRETRSEPTIQALVGTRIEMDGIASRPVASVVLCLEGGRRIAAQVSDDGLTFSIPVSGEETVLVERSGSYWLELIDRDALRGVGDRWEIVAVPDVPPTVVIEQPTANVFVTPEAVVPLRVVARDDLALQSICLAFRRDKTEKDELLPLYTGPANPSPKSISSLTAAMSRGDRRVVESRWDVAALGLQPGDQLTFWAAATDYASQTVKSESRRLTVIHPQELEDRLVSRQRLLLAELDRALKMERNCQSQVESLVARFASDVTNSPVPSHGNCVEQAEIDRLQAAQLGQREVVQVLTSAEEGVPMHVRALLTELANNSVDRTDIQRRMRDLLDAIEKLDRQLLTPLGCDLTAAAKTAQIELQDRSQSQGSEVSSPNGTGMPNSAVVASLVASLIDIGKRQGEVVVVLERMLGQLGQWDTYRGFYRELSQLLRDQEDIGRVTKETGRRTLTQAFKDLPLQDAAALKEIGGRQFDIARRLDRIFQDMERTGETLRQSDPAASASLAAAMAERRRSDLDGQMRAAAGEVEQNQIGRAVVTQKQVAAKLREVCDLLANPGPRSVERSDGAVQLLHGRQKKLIEETKRLQAVEASQTGFGRADVAAVRDLARQQRLLQADTAQFGQQLDGDGAFQAAVAAAAEQMHQAASLLERNNVGPDAEQAEQQALQQLGVLLEVLQSAKGDVASQAAHQSGTADGSPTEQPNPLGRGEQKGKLNGKSGKLPGEPSAAQKAGASTEERQPRKLSPSELRGAMKQLWGELPQHAREQMLQTPVEEFPTKYEQSIEDYFRRLAEEKPKQ